MQSRMSGYLEKTSCLRSSIKSHVQVGATGTEHEKQKFSLARLAEAWRKMQHVWLVSTTGERIVHSSSLLQEIVTTEGSTVEKQPLWPALNQASTPRWHRERPPARTSSTIPRRWSSVTALRQAREQRPFDNLVTKTQETQ